MDTLEELGNAIDAFNDERGWGRFQSPAGLAKSIAIEAGELLECFQWDEENYSLEAVREELADVMIYSLRMASIMRMDVKEIIFEKLEKNALKYPL